MVWGSEQTPKQGEHGLKIGFGGRGHVTAGGNW